MRGTNVRPKLLVIQRLMYCLLQSEERGTKLRYRFRTDEANAQLTGSSLDVILRGREEIFVSD